MIEGFDNVGVVVTDYRAAVDFYEKLGFKVDFEEAEGGSLRAGNAVLSTCSGLPPRPRCKAGTYHLPATRRASTHISLRVSDVDAEYTRLRKAGVTVETEPADHHLGSRTITILDPDGNRIWFLGPLKGKPAMEG